MSFKKILKSLLIVACISMLPGCHTSKKSKVSKGDLAHTEHVKIGKIDKNRQAILDEAYTWLGTPYEYARQDKGKGTDCSGMVMVVYEKVTGEKLPRNSAKQAEYCESIKADKVNAGDLIFFATGKDAHKISHVGIVIDNENFIHASSSKGVVISQFTTPYYQRTFKMFGRVPKIRFLSENIIEKEEE